eukprot:CAMPEP_0197847268 /NCGR_PEP_ID=MMETSP1438-20131217/5677_1 /TAXON_ID=1461541 /ORGANISM="Pterosperma sp., Strain CCMP1384" /LENGTH=406 /DNA_ID=CAMNT_0043459139 /DNA_START=331 /DNA_END=1551 /DNA_ORIENTATION=+
MASGFSSEFGAKLRPGAQQSWGLMLTVFFLAIFFAFNTGYYSTIAFHGAAKVGAYGEGTDVTSLGACTLRTKQAQVGFFSSHACWYNISRRPDWVATRMFFQARAEAVKTKGAGYVDDKCGFISIGTGQYELSQTQMNAYTQDYNAQVKMQLDDFVNNMRAASVFDQCYTFTYTPESQLPTAQQALAGNKIALVRPLWMDADTTLDTEYEKITSTIIEGTIFVKIAMTVFESDLLAGFKTGLGSGRVGALIWERAVHSDMHVRTLKDEVEFVSSFGYAVYLASAMEAEMNQQFQRVFKPSVFLRLDRGLWDNVYGLENADMSFTIVAVLQDHPFREYLDTHHSLCPIHVGRGGVATCNCELELYEEAPDTCGLAYQMQHQVPEGFKQNLLKTLYKEWRQPLAQPRV